LQTPAEFMRQWLPYRDKFIECVLDMEGPAISTRDCVNCGTQYSLWRCLDCADRAMLCTACCRERHRHHYLHRVEKWSWYYEASSLYEVGVKLRLGHNRLACQSSQLLSDEKLRVVDTNGVHDVRITWCACPQAAEHPLQLLSMGLYPASVISPKTAFTFRVLSDFLLANKVSAITAQSYFQRLRRLTNPAFPHRVPDRYRELLRCSRQWRNMKHRKWNGFGHDQGEVPAGGLALDCVACPRPTVNLAPGWENDEDQWKFMPTFVMDGNFSAEHLRPRGLGDDVALGDGQGFMVTDAPYKAHLANSREVSEQSKCNAHKAVNRGAAARADMEATGIGAVACGRHGCFLPHAVVDFQKGERQMNMDYALSEALKSVTGAKRLLVMYDVACQYSKKLPKRFTDSSSLTWPASAEVVYWGIGLFHVHAHQRECLPKYSPSFIPGAGTVDGEIIETLWSSLNRIASSTRAMSTSHRKEVMDDHMNDSNWRKTVGMVTMLCKRFQEASKNKTLSLEFLQALEQSANPAQLQEWRDIEVTARAERHHNLDVMMPYEVTMEKAPGRREMQLRLEADEGRKADEPGQVSWLAEGIALPEQQLGISALARSLGRQASVDGRLKLVARRNRLQHALGLFETKASMYWGEDTDDEEVHQATLYNEWEDVDDEPIDEWLEQGEPEDAIHPETIPVRLPSTLGLNTLTRRKQQELAHQELQLREGQANDALHRLREVLGMKSVVFATDVREAQNSQRLSTRAWNNIQSLAKTINEHARVYTHARDAMKRLLMEDQLASRFQPLEQSDLRVITEVVDNKEPGARDKAVPWIWAVDVGGDTANSAWLTEMHRVNWLRQKARSDRWKEQHVLVQEEMKQTVRTFEWKASRWDSLQGHIRPGHQSYARRQSALWRGMAVAAREEFLRVAGLAIPDTST
ncbi:hypothetical protein FOMPIDRAFT_59073, partial [Fomitopsis schrenkii]